MNWTFVQGIQRPIFSGIIRILRARTFQLIHTQKIGFLNQEKFFLCQYQCVRLGVLFHGFAFPLIGSQDFEPIVKFGDFGYFSETACRRFPEFFAR